MKSAPPLVRMRTVSALDRLPLASLRTLAEFVAFLRSKSGQDDGRAGSGRTWEGTMHQDEREVVERYAAAYREQPETDEEVAVTYAMSQEALAGDPWE